MSRRRHEEGLGLDAIESLVARLFAEKQASTALLALLLVGYLATAQFLMLRVVTAADVLSQAPPLSERLDVSCEGGEPRWAKGSAPDREQLAGKPVVVFLDSSATRCLEKLSKVGVGQLLLGIPAGDEGEPASRGGR